MYAVIHGGVDPQLRAQSCAYLAGLPFDGYAIGGSLGKTRPEMVAMLTELMPQVPSDKPNHLLGIADIPSLEAIVPLGVDTFDSSYPTKSARHGHLFTAAGTLIISQGKYKSDLAPIDPACDCYTCKTHSRCYIHHLFKAHELTAYTLATIHNVRYMINYMAKLRADILRDIV